MANFLQERHNHFVLRLMNDPDTRNWVREWAKGIGGNLANAGLKLKHLDLILAGKSTELENLEEFACLWISGKTEVPASAHSFFLLLDKKDIPYGLYQGHLHYGEILKAFSQQHKVHGFFHRKNFTEAEWAMFELAQENE